MTLWDIEYYTRPNGDQPVALWLGQLSIDHRKVIEAKIVALAQYGTQLLDTRALKPSGVAIVIYMS